MFDEAKLVHFTHKNHTKNVTTYCFSKLLERNKIIRGEIEVVWNKKVGVSYELMQIESPDDKNTNKTYNFIPVNSQPWFQKNLELIIDSHRRSFELSSVFRSNEQ